MEQYSLYFASLVLFNIALAYHRHLSEAKARGEETLALPSISGKDGASKFKKEYFGVYALVVAADWLQGPYMYTLYKDEKGLEESIVAALFTTGFICAAITASFVGSLADQHGRKAGCVVFCIVYSMSCLTVLSNDTFILFVGRALGGLSTTLLYTVFETWMVAEHHKRELSDRLSLGSMFSMQITLSGVVAIVAGVTGETIVAYTGSKTSPFLAAAVCLALAFVGIQNYWSENYGEATSEKAQGVEGLRLILIDIRILTLSLASCIFEGSMYLFVFFWSPSLKSARAASGNSTLPPFGLIFSCFMCAMMTGSLLFSTFQSVDKQVRGSVNLLTSILALACNALLITVLVRSENVTFWAFALFEVCVGLYFPTMSHLRSQVVEDAVRAKVYGLMRMPLNLFVVIALGVTQEGDAHRDKVFTVVGALMLGAFVVVHRYLR